MRSTFTFLVLVGLIALAPRTASAACASPAGGAGEMIYNADYNTVQFCDNTSWISMSGTVATESDPQVGAVTNNQWCRGDGTSIQCDQAAPSGATSSGAAGFLQLSGGSGAFASSSATAGQQLFWDTTNHRLGIGTVTPLSLLHTYSTIVSPSSGEANGVGQIRIDNGATALTNASGLEFKIAGDTNGYGSKIQALNSSGSQLVFAGRQGSPTWTEYMRIASGGNVGIGTTNPGAELHVDGTSELLRLTSSGFGTIYAGSDVNNPWFGTSTNHDLRLITNGTEKVRIKAGGNVGIATTDPQALLQIGNSIAPGTAEATHKGLLQINSGGDLASSSGLEFKSSSFGTGFGWKIASPDRGSGNAPMSIAYRNNAATWTEALTLRSDTGNVGIGTTNPQGTLTIYSNGSVSGGTASPLKVVAGPSSPYGAGITIDSNAATGGRSYLIHSTAAGAGEGQGKLVISDQNATGAVRMAIDSSGNVGIGTTSPASKLDVNGAISATSVNSMKSYIFYGNNGSVSCDTFCQNIGNPWGASNGSCLGAKAGDNSRYYSCSDIPGIGVGGANMPCLCTTF